MILCLPWNVCAYIDSNSVNIQVSSDKQEITIGDPVVYTVEITKDPSLELKLPKIEKNIGNFAVKKLISQKQMKKKDKIIDKYEYLITSFNTGTQILPSFQIFVVDDDRREIEVKSEGLVIKVKSVLPADSDVKEIRGIKALIIKSDLWIRLLIYAAAALVLAALIYIASKKIKFRRKKLSPITLAIQTAEEIAMQRLKELKHSGLIKRGKVKDFYFILSDIVRQYLENRYQIPAKELTTNEIIGNLSDIKDAQEYLAYFKEFLDYCDMVKFSPFSPSEIASEEILNRAREIIRLTRPKLEARSA